MLNFEKPIYKIAEYVENSNYGKFELEPLERGFGITLGNALRRVMLSSMPGSAIVAIKIDGVMHEFQTIEGVVEDVTTIVLNLKNVVVKNHSEETKVCHINVSEERVVTAADIVCDSDVEIINKDLGYTIAVTGRLKSPNVSEKEVKDKINQLCDDYRNDQLKNDSNINTE